MKINEGNTDRILRVVGGVALAALGFGGVIAGGLGLGIGVVGIVLVLTGAIGFCPLYALFGISTCRVAKVG
jgi:hypothetical protein